MRLIYVIVDKYFISIALGFPLFKHRGIRHYRSLLFYFKICGLKFIAEPFYQGNVGKLNKRLKKLSQFGKIF